ncbi:hypothetical protein LRD69_29395 [Streptomyces sp. JH14]|uniref:hypothetical protein n=1 Tax=Streptomyces sp. JH14 TaxID=2793630 RepID=UPI0023F7DCE3|nr:hypothetical protein [Streptomyces sp. JH14]MDF6046169.1 hypothetical protein [Streptomyces sp. JH14]
MTAARQTLVALLLVVFSVVGGASAAVAAAGAGTPPRFLSGPESAAAHTPAAPTPARRTDLTARTGPPHDTRRTRTATATGHELTRVPAVPRPWVATDHIRIQHQLPPPGPGGALLPGPFGIQVPLPARHQAADAPSFAADRFRVALPGVRGPPRTDRSLGHRSARQI